MRRKIPSLQALACFDCAARHQSYTRAAQELALTQSAISRQIAALEDYLGVLLFRRTRHGVALTDAGTQYARQISPHLLALERDTLDAMSGQGKGGSITLASVPTFAARWLVPRLGDFDRRHPDIVVHIDSRTRPFLFAESDYDCAIHAASEDEIRLWAGTRATRLLPEVVIPVCSPQLIKGRKYLGADEILRLPRIQQSTRAHAWQQWMDQVRSQTEQPSSDEGASILSGPRFEQFSMTTAAAINGMGIALIPKLLIEAELDSGALVQAHPHALAEQRHYYLVRAEGREVRPAILVFESWLITEAEKSVSDAASAAAQ